MKLFDFWTDRLISTPLGSAPPTLDSTDTPIVGKQALCFPAEQTEEELGSLLGCFDRAVVARRRVSGQMLACERPSDECSTKLFVTLLLDKQTKLPLHRLTEEYEEPHRDLVTFWDIPRSHFQPNHFRFAPGGGGGASCCIRRSVALQKPRIRVQLSQVTHTHLSTAARKNTQHALPLSSYRVFRESSQYPALKTQKGCEPRSAHLCAADTDTSSWHSSRVRAWGESVSM